MKRLTPVLVLGLCIQTAALLSVGTQTVSAQSNAAPVAADDLYNASQDSLLVVPAPGLLGNDEVEIPDSFLVVLVDAPANGTLSIAPDGSFSYEPVAGFSGTDTFTYLLETVPVQQLTVDSSSSSIDVDMSLQVIASTAQDAEIGSLSGTTTILLTPFEAPFSEAQLLAIDLTVNDSLDLEFAYGGNLNIFASADTNAFQLSLLQPGPVAEVANGAFTQPDNVVNLSGSVDLVGTGLFAGLVPDSALTFDAEDMINLTGGLDQMDDELSLDIAFSIIDTLDLGSAIAFLDVSGNVLSTGPLRQPVQSNVATVSISVEAPITTATEEELPIAFALEQNYPNPFNPVTTIAFSVPSAEHVSLSVFDALGREVRRLVDGTLPAGTHAVQFNAEQLPSGVYLYRLQTLTRSDSKTLMLVK